MKKRIICLILTVVMLSLSLASCGFSFIEDDLSAYATFDDSVKAAFEEAIKNLSITDGDFTTDPATREKKVLDKVYAALADVSTKTGKTEGVIGEHDVLFYCYYMTCEKEEGKTIQLVFDTASNTKGDYMKSANALSIQMGSNFPSDLEKAILEAAASYDFGDTENDYKNKTSGSKPKNGDVAFISYSYEYKDETGKTISDTVSMQKVVLDEEDALHYYLFHKVVKATTEGGKDTVTDINIGTTASDFSIEGGYEINGAKIETEIKISKAKIEYVVNGSAFAPITQTTYTEDKEMKDPYGNVVNLKDLPITYYVYPVKYTAVEELTAENIINLVYAENFTETVYGNIMYGPDFSSKTEDECKEIAEDFKVTENGKELTFAEFATSLYEALKKCKDTKSTLDKEKENLKKAETTLSDAEAEAKKTDLSETEKKAADEAVEKAKKSVSDCKISVNTAQTEYDKAVEAKDIKIATALTLDAEFAKTIVAARIKADLEAKKEALDAAEKALKEANETNEDNKKALEEATEALEKAKTALDAANAALEAAKAAAEADGATDEVKAAYEAAKTAAEKATTERSDAEKAKATAQTKATTSQEALTKAQTEYDKANKDYTDAKAELDPQEAEYATKSAAMKDTIKTGYKNLIYSDLQESYRTEIEQNIAKKVYELMEKHVKVDDVPDKISDKIYKQLYENYEYAFYTDTRLESDTETSSSKPGFYNKYNGSFKKFVTEYAVPTDIGTKVENYEQALEAMRAYADETVKPIVRMYVLAKAYNVVFTDEDLDNYLDDPNNKGNKDAYAAAEFYYGEDNVRYALQFNKLMNYFIESEEKTDDNDKRFKWDEYKNVTVTEYTKAED